MKQIISLLIVALFAYGAWKGWEQWEEYSTGSDLQEAQQSALANIDPARLAGMPQEWEAAYQQATNGGTAAWKTWMKNFGQRVDDPRRAWIELDYMVKISLEDPQEAKAIFAGVKERTPTNSPVYPRILRLRKTYE